MVLCYRPYEEWTLSTVELRCSGKFFFRAFSLWLLWVQKVLSELLLVGASSWANASQQWVKAFCSEYETCSISSALVSISCLGAWLC